MFLFHSTNILLTKQLMIIIGKTYNIQDDFLTLPVIDLFSLSSRRNKKDVLNKILLQIFRKSILQILKKFF